MTAEEMWRESGLTGRCEAWSFGEAQDKLAGLVKEGMKTATCSSYDLYMAQGEPIPEPGDYSIILDGKGNAVCIVRTISVDIIPFDQVSEKHAYKEGEGDRSLAYWRQIHESFLKRELSLIGQDFHEKTEVVCEEFELVYTPAD